MKKLLFANACATIIALLLAGPAVAAGNGAVVANECPIASCNFQFWDGNFSLVTYVVDAYHDVITPSGNETETFHGTVGNNTGTAVLLAPGVGPIPSDQTCYSFATQNTTPDWQLIISASGSYTLVCHFH